MDQMTLETGIVAPLPPRPRIDDEAIKKAAMDAFAEEVCNWLGDGERSKVRAELEKCLDDDGYQFAKNLERRFYWEVNAELVELLDGYDSHLYGAHFNAVAHWRKLNRITKEEESTLVSQ